MADRLYTSTDQIYPGQNLTLTCNTTVNNTIKWTRNGIEVKKSDAYIIEQNLLIVKNITPEDSGKSHSITLARNIAHVVSKYKCVITHVTSQS